VAVTTDILPPRYREPERIGRGGMGDIYRATDSVLGRDVAVKILVDRYAQDEPVREPRGSRASPTPSRSSTSASTTTGRTS
jgi:serine/threonine protein kinase